MAEAALAVSGLVRRFGATRALSGVDLTVPAGSAFGLLGPNGAGKSTLVRIVLGFLPADEGDARIFGRPAAWRTAREGVGFLPERFAYPGWLTGLELLAHHARLLGYRAGEARREALRQLERVGLAEAARRRIRGYSKGMQQRLGIALSLVGGPRLLVWDEPTSALDPLGRVLVRDLMLEERRRGATVFLNSHLLGEVERVCDRVAVIDRGRVLREGPLGDLLLARLRLVVEAEPVGDELVRELGRWGRVLRAEGAGSRRIEMEVGEREAVAEVARLLTSAGARLYRLEPRGESLEEFFLEALRDAAASGARAPGEGL
ncbi:MAG: ABC transporter ATP-binding protein [Clostridia bacterium]|nr:ABC transporter ATP-binding protein [Clostridia bacterium]